MTPYELVLQHYELPFTLEPLQADSVNRLAPVQRAGLYDEVGTGKTAMSTVNSMYKRIIGRSITIVLMPPVIIPQWRKWLTVKCKGVGKVIAYRGTPAERAALNLDGAEYVLMSIQIFKKDYEYLSHVFEHLAVTVIVDEATSIKNPGSQNHKRVRDFSVGRDLMLLTATPLTKPGDGYAYIKLVSPTIYRNQRHFESLHVGERDFFNNITKWCNLDYLADNLMVNASRILLQEMHPGMETPNYIPIEYDLEPEHYALYKRLADEQLLLLEDGGKIDATTAPKLYNAIQQIVCNPAHFSGNPKFRPAAYDILDILIDQVGVTDEAYGGKLLVFANYRMTHRALAQYLKMYNAVALFGEISSSQQEKNKARFLEDKSCRILHCNPQSGGYGLDELQHVCSNILFIEEPIVPKDFHQPVGRLYRNGQKSVANVHIAVAQRTIQVRLHASLLKNDALVNQVQGGFQDLKDAIYGA
jgi:SNF2 family DNA or RNA helicase